MATDKNDKRPDPDALLADVQAQEARRRRGKLKIFFGAAAGVGKTYAMLTAGRAKAGEGVDVVVGYAEPHARPETEAILLGLDLLPHRIVEYRGTTLKEFDLDAALKRKPELILVDELAHSNAPGSRHDRRWQDIEELLQAGIDVYTTVNVQHLESLNDVVAQISGVIVRETLPDRVFEEADEIELVDLSPDELLERLAEGKVYVPDQARYALEGFFRKPNLTALRELALRKTADRVGDQVLTARREQFTRKTWPTAERVLVCVSPSRSSARVIRSAKRLAVSLHADLIAAYVETPRLRDIGAHDRNLLLRHFRLAERLGAETVTLTGPSTADEIVSYARSRNVSKIVVGKSDRPWWIDQLFRSTADVLMRRTGEIDLYVVRGIGEEAGPEVDDSAPVAEPGIDWPAYGWTTLVIMTCSAIVGLMVYGWGHDVDRSNLLMIYLVGVAFIAARYGRGPSAYASFLSVAVFDYFFVHPRLSFAVGDTQYLIAFLVMLGVALLIGTLTVRLRDQVDASRNRERRTEALYQMTQQLAGAGGTSALVDTATRHLRDVFHARVALLLPGEDGRLMLRAPSDPQIADKDSEVAVAQWVFEHRSIAGHGTDTLPSSESLYVPLMAGGQAVGVLAIQTAQTPQLLAPEQRQLLDALCNQIALAVERNRFAHEARTSQVQAETEKLRSSLLSSVSHDLRTPLAVITGASSSLLDRKPADESSRELLRIIQDESERLTRLVGNLLDITRLESGTIALNKQWQPLEEVVGSALGRMDIRLTGRAVETNIPGDLPMVAVDGVLLEQALIHLIENAIKYTPADSPIEVTARAADGQVVVEVADSGPGLEPGEERKVFEKFYRGGLSHGQRGAGLGLPICRAIIEAHGGRVWAQNRTPPLHGAVFRFTIPVDGAPPALDPSRGEPDGVTPNA
ncbi:MAG: sensor histidine kinase KdpD [Planctomycetes bacterium]|nr:sensor histidine kinase KdpD [Planctomycetota bacterium]